MADCIDCGKEIPQTPDGTSICMACVDKREAQLTPVQRMAMAKVGAVVIYNKINGIKPAKGS
jgi:hypothetical protein